MYSISDAEKLVQLARKSIADAFSNKDTIDRVLEKKFSKKQGVFITLNIDGQLRGCIGFPLPHYSLYKGIINCARSAAFEDPRFNPVVEEELNEISIDISIMTVPEEITVDNKNELPSRIKVGRDGLIIRSGLGSGLLLPQVFTEYNVDSLGALSMVCQKAGLASDAWKEDGVVIEKFEAQVFKEESPKGKIVVEKRH